MTEADTHSSSLEDLDQTESQLLRLVAGSSGPVRGRTKLMKLGFFGEFYDRDNDGLRSTERVGAFDDFVIYDHGPFSRDLMEAFDRLKDRGLLDEQTELTFRGNRRNDVSLTDRGERVVERLDTDTETRDIVERFDDYSATEAESESLELLGIGRHEKDEYRLIHVSEIV
ncbi:hypothetical protein RYH80_07965 [Halobaculum sp. MBLA0147]|uniref:hypothetical protein n=1 Tax=Halobaculum sp. MBLA0147 TaxID=3079934 RepID=UPI0035239281